MDIPENLSQYTQIMIDSYFMVDLDRNIVDFNRAFHSMLPRPLARNLKTRKCYEVLNLGICKGKCIAKECWEEKRAIRLDEIAGHVAGEEEELVFILSAIPLFAPDGQMVGAMVMHRNVTDEAQVQVKYQRQMEAAASERQTLNVELAVRTRRLFEVSRRMHSLQKELFTLKTHMLD